MALKSFSPDFSKYSYDDFRIHSVAMDVFNQLKRIDPNTILAGGAPRDWYFGTIPSDYDIYIKVPSNTSLEKFVNFIMDAITVTNKDLIYDLFQINSSNPNYKKDYLNSVFQIDFKLEAKKSFQLSPFSSFATPGSYRAGALQIMFVNELLDLSDPINLLNSFCCNLSESYFDGSSTLYTDSFLYGVDTKRLLFDRNIAPAYKNKMLRKFPNFTLDFK